MTLLVVGSVALDSVKTPFGEKQEVLGGSATYFSVAGSFFTPISIVAVVGKDFPEEEIRFLESKGVNLKGLQYSEGKTFRWKGEYGFDLNQASTIETQLNVFENFSPTIPQEYKDKEYIFLANIDPELQLNVLNQAKKPKVVACDTMDYWITRKPKELMETLKQVDILIINEAETRELAQEPNLVKASKYILSCGPKILIVKRGEYGALMFSQNSVFSAPAYPLESIFDPTGAGDAFAGGFMGFLGYTQDLDEENVKKAIIFGSVMASFTVEEFSLDRLKRLTYSEIEDRYRKFRKLSYFHDL